MKEIIITIDDEGVLNVSCANMQLYEVVGMLELAKAVVMQSEPETHDCEYIQPFNGEIN